MSLVLENGVFLENKHIRNLIRRGHSPLFLLLITPSKPLTIFNTLFLESREKTYTFAAES